MRHLGDNLRGLLGQLNIFEDLKFHINSVLKIHPDWNGPIKAVNDWLYFDSSEAPEDYVVRVKDWYEELFPSSSTDRLILLSAGWSGDFHDPNVLYDRENDNDHDYAAKSINEIVAGLSDRSEDHIDLLKLLVRGEHNSVWILTHSLAQRVEDPARLIEIACGHLEEQSYLPICVNTFCGIISGSYRRDSNLGLQCLNIALDTKALSKFSISLISAAELDADLAQRVADLVSTGSCDPRYAATLSCGKGFDDHGIDAVMPLGKAIERTGPDGVWSALDFMFMYRYGQTGAFSEKASYIKELCLHKDIFSIDAVRTMDSHHWTASIQKIFDLDLVDDSFIDTTVSRCLELATLANHDVQLKMDDAAQKILLTALEHKPEVVWEKVLAAFSVADEITKWRIGNLLKGPGRTPGQPGILANLPEEIYTTWLEKDPLERLPFVLDWIELVESSDAETDFWSPNFLNLITRHTTEISQLTGIHSRLVSGVSWGPLSSRFKPLLPLFESLQNNSNQVVRKWASMTIKHVRSEIEEHEKREANDEAGHRL